MSIATHTLPRVLTGAGPRPLTLQQHEEFFGPARMRRDLLDELGRSGLTGRGGAAFPTAVKAALLRDQHARKKFVVVNAMEGEPAAHKDYTLASVNPHLVLDGALALAGAIGASHVAICVAREKTVMINHFERAVHERERRGSLGVTVEIHTPPGRYIAGEESALVHWLDDNETLPQFRPERPSILSIGRAPVLVDNTETHAHVGLILRYGADWFRSLGTTASPGSTLVSVSGAVARPVVLEIALGTPIREILAAAGADTAPRALLLGGYGGTFVDGSAVSTPYANELLRPLGASVGAGVIVVLPQQSCGITETFNIARWMANESARQCGPCAFGLPALAESLGHLAVGGRDAKDALALIRERSGVINGRGACRHPDGVVRLVQSALSVFADDAERHAAGHPCAHAGHSRFASVPRLELEHELVWE